MSTRPKSIRTLTQKKPGSGIMKTRPGGVARLYAEVRDILHEARAGAARAVNFSIVAAYWQVGRRIVEHEQAGKERADYGSSLLTGLAARLQDEFGSGFTEANLRNMRQFYLAFPAPGAGKLYALRRELSWTHYRLIMRVEEAVAREWYINEAVAAGWSSRQLERQISTLYYERLLASKKKAPVRKEAGRKLAALPALTPEEVFRDPCVLEFTGLKAHASYRENDLESSLIGNLQGFLLELGRGFAFVARQQRMQMDGEDFYVDLVFYNFLLRCFVLIDLKVGKLTHQDIGQMDSYVRIYAEQFAAPGDQPPIGLILCSEKNEAIARYSVLSENRRLFASRYLLHLPSEKVLQRELMRERREFEMRLAVKNQATRKAQPKVRRSR